MIYYRLQDQGYTDVIIKYDYNSFYIYNYTLNEWQVSEQGFHNYIEIDETEALNQIKENNEVLDRNLLIAKEIAEIGHLNQMDKSNKPYIEHIYHVVDGVIDKEAKIVAYLHDVLEETSVNPEELIQKGIMPRLVESVQRLTRTKETAEEEKYFEYLIKIKTDPVAREVKISDLKHNMDPSRIINTSLEDEKRLAKYRKGLELLQ